MNHRYIKSEICSGVHTYDHPLEASFGVNFNHWLLTKHLRYIVHIECTPVPYMF